MMTLIDRLNENASESISTFGFTKRVNRTCRGAPAMHVKERTLAERSRNFGTVIRLDADADMTLTRANRSCTTNAPRCISRN